MTDVEDSDFTMTNHVSSEGHPLTVPVLGAAKAGAASTVSYTLYIVAPSPSLLWRYVRSSCVWLLHATLTNISIHP